MAASSTDPWRWREHLRKSMTLVPAAETLPVQRAAGRLLARPLHSPEDVPSGPVRTRIPAPALPRTRSHGPA